jgi:hypothetical protein
VRDGAQTGDAARLDLPDVSDTDGNDRHADRKLSDQVAAIALRKYGWGDGLPVKITPRA